MRDDDEMSNTMIGIFKKVAPIAKKHGYNDVSIEAYLYYDEYENESCSIRLYRGKEVKRFEVASFRDSVGFKLYCKQGTFLFDKEDFRNVVLVCLPITGKRVVSQLK